MEDDIGQHQREVITTAHARAITQCCFCHVRLSLDRLNFEWCTTCGATRYCRDCHSAAVKIEDVDESGKGLESDTVVELRRHLHGQCQPASLDEVEAIDLAMSQLGPFEKAAQKALWLERALSCQELGAEEKCKLLDEAGCVFSDGLGQHLQATCLHEQQLHLAREVIRSRRDEALALRGMGEAMRLSGHKLQALEAFDAQLAVARELNDLDLIGTALAKKGRVLQELSTTKEPRQEAGACYDEFLQLAQAAGDVQQQARAHLALATWSRLIKDHQACAIHAKKAMPTFVACGDVKRQCKVFCLLQAAEKWIGTLAASFRYNEEHLALAEQHGDDAEISTASGNLGLCYLNMGKNHKAIVHMGRCLAVDLARGDVPGAARISGFLGMAYHAIGRYQQSIECFELQLRSAQVHGERDTENRAYSHLANAYSSLGQHRWALKLYKKHYDASHHSGDRDSEQWVCGLIGDHYVLQGNLEQAKSWYDARLHIATELHNTTGIAEAHLSLGRLCAAQKQFPQAFEHLNACRAVVVGQKSLHGVWARVTGRLAVTHILSGDGETGHALLADFEALCAQENHNEILADTLFDAAAALGALALTCPQHAQFAAQATHAARQSLSTLVNLRLQLQPEQLSKQFSFMEKEAKTAKLLQALLVAANKPATALLVADGSRSQTLLRRLQQKSRETEKAHEQQDGASSVDPPSLAADSSGDTAEDVADGGHELLLHASRTLQSAIVYYAISSGLGEAAPPLLLVWAATPTCDEPVFVAQPFNEDYLHAQIQQCNEATSQIYFAASRELTRQNAQKAPGSAQQTEAEGEEWRAGRHGQDQPATTRGGGEAPWTFEASRCPTVAQLRSLYDLLMPEPVSRLLASCGEDTPVLFCPVGFLHKVPFGALCSPQFRVVLQDHPVAVITSLQATLLAHQCHMAKLQRAQLRATDPLVIGNPFPMPVRPDDVTVSPGIRGAVGRRVLNTDAADDGQPILLFPRSHEAQSARVEDEPRPQKAETCNSAAVEVVAKHSTFSQALDTSTECRGATHLCELPSAGLEAKAVAEVLGCPQNRVLIGCSATAVAVLRHLCPQASAGGSSRGEVGRLTTATTPAVPMPMPMFVATDEERRGKQSASTAETTTVSGSPRFIHMATHGVRGFRSNETNALWDLNGFLAFAPTEEHNGLVSAHSIAMEASLDDTELAVLSACETHVAVSGEDAKSVPAEGVTGLSLAFLMAGASRTVVTLWPIYDEHTSKLMEEFYVALEADKHAVLPIGHTARALRRAVHRMCSRHHLFRQRPFLWAGVLCVGLP